MKTSDKVDLIIPALVKAQAEMGSSVTKDSKNPFYRSTYATLNAVLEVVVPVLNKHGVWVSTPPVVMENGTQVVEVTLFHESGQFVSGSMQVLTAKNNDPQALGSGVSYSRRYTLMSMLSLGAEDDDGEKAMARPKANLEPKVKVSEEDKSKTSVVEQSDFNAEIKKPTFRKSPPKKEEVNERPTSTTKSTRTISTDDDWE